MMDIELIGLILACSLAAVWVMIGVFGWGYRKEQRGERYGKRK